MTKRSLLLCAALLVLTGADTIAQSTANGEARLATWGENLYVGSNNETILGPPSDLVKPQPIATPAATSSGGQVPPSFIRPVTTTGPYRRVFSRPGFSYVSASITLPCTAARLRGDGQKDLNTGFVYTGGWGGTQNGAAVDAGFQKSSYQKETQKEHYTLFIAFASRITSSGLLKYKTRPQDPDLTPYPCGQDVKLEFFSDQHHVLHLIAAGTDEHGKGLNQTITHPTVPGDGWDASGGGISSGIEIKRMVSIAQRSGDSVHGPWYFGHDAAAGTPLIRWRNVHIGHSAHDAHSWSRADTYACQDVPSEGLFRVQFTAYDDEAVALDLNGIPSNQQRRPGPAVLGVPPGCG